MTQAPTLPRALHIRADSAAVARVMRELGVDRLVAERHVQQLRRLQARLREQHARQVAQARDAWARQA